MALAAVTIKIMPTSPEVDLKKLRADVEATIKKIGGILHNCEEQPIAFGLKALIFIIGWPESKDPDAIETELSKIKNVNSAEITDVRRAFG
jgi:elongation factor 1-beta